MDPMTLSLIAVVAYGVIGVFVLRALAKRYEWLWPSMDWSGMPLVDAIVAVVWVIAWPLHLVLLPWTRQIPLAPDHEPTDQVDAGHRVRVGAEGVSATDLRPRGCVEIDGQRYEAQAQNGFIPTGQAVAVVGRLKKCLVVRAR